MRAALAALMILTTGCLAGDEPAGDDSAAPTTQPEPADEPQPSSPRAVPAMLPSDLVAADAAGPFYRIDRFTGNATRLALRPGLPDDANPLSIRWGPDGALYATFAAAEPGVARIDLAAGAVELVAAGAPFDYPYALTVLRDGRILVADSGGWHGPPGSPLVEVPRILAVDPGSGDVRVVVADARLSGVEGNWMDIAVGADDTVYLASGGSDHRLTTPTDPSDDAGRGAVWQLDPDTGVLTLVSSSDLFRHPSSLAVGASGDLFVTEYAPTRTVFRLDAATGEAVPVASVPGEGYLWGVEELADARLVVADNCSDPLELTDDACGPGALWIVDPASGSVELLASDPSFAFLSHVRVWRA